MRPSPPFDIIKLNEEQTMPRQNKNSTFFTAKVVIISLFIIFASRLVGGRLVQYQTLHHK